MNIEDKLYPILFLYKKLPIRFKVLIGKVYSCLPQRIRYGTFYFEYLNRIIQFEKKSVFEKEEWSKEKIQKTLINAVENVDYYKRYRTINLDCFPLISKDIIQIHSHELINNSLLPKKLSMNSGGSSGTPITFFLHKGISRAKEKAHFNWYWSLFGYKPKSKVLMIRGESLNSNLWEYQPIDNRLALSCYLINKSNIQKVIDQINKFDPEFIHAYPSSLRIFTQLLEDKKTTLNCKIKAIFLGSEYLFDHDRAFFERKYGAKVVTWYGHSERLVFGGNCPFCNEFHFYPFYGHIELLDNTDKPITEVGKIGRIIATGFDNEVMPLIRYDTGDLGELSGNNNCKCGFQGITLKRIIGREQDFIVLSDNAKVPLTAFIFGQHFKEFEKIREMQIVQDVVGLIVLRIVPRHPLQDEDIRNLRKKLEASVLNKIKVNIQFVDNLEKTHRGKHIFLKQKLEII